jgi:hypothetical protein
MFGEYVVPRHLLIVECCMRPEIQRIIEVALVPELELIYTCVRGYRIISLISIAEF